MKTLEIGNKLRKLRQIAGLSQGEVADEFGLSSSQYVSNWERGLCTPAMTMIPKLKIMYGINSATVERIYIEETKLKLAQFNKD